MVRGGGLEPPSSDNHELSNRGRKKTTRGQNQPKSEQPQELAEKSNVESGTDRHPANINLGTLRDHNKHITAHNRAITDTGPSDDLQEIIQAWPDLPEAIRSGIIAMVKAVKK